MITNQYHCDQCKKEVPTMVLSVYLGRDLVFSSIRYYDIKGDKEVTIPNGTYHFCDANCFAKFIQSFHPLLTPGTIPASQTK